MDPNIVTQTGGEGSTEQVGGSQVDKPVEGVEASDKISFKPPGTERPSLNKEEKPINTEDGKLAFTFSRDLKPDSNPLLEKNIDDESVDDSEGLTAVLNAVNSANEGNDNDRTLNDPIKYEVFDGEPIITHIENEDDSFEPVLHDRPFEKLSDYNLVELDPDVVSPSFLPTFDVKDLKNSFETKEGNIILSSTDDPNYDDVFDPNNYSLELKERINQAIKKRNELSIYKKESIKFLNQRISIDEGELSEKDLNKLKDQEEDPTSYLNLSKKSEKNTDGINWNPYSLNFGEKASPIFPEGKSNKPRSGSYVDLHRGLRGDNFDGRLSDEAYRAFLLLNLNQNDGNKFDIYENSLEGNDDFNGQYGLGIIQHYNSENKEDSDYKPIEEKHLKELSYAIQEYTNYIKVRNFGKNSANHVWLKYAGYLAPVTMGDKNYLSGFQATKNQWVNRASEGYIDIDNVELKSDKFHIPDYYIEKIKNGTIEIPKGSKRKYIRVLKQQAMLASAGFLPRDGEGLYGFHINGKFDKTTKKALQEYNTANEKSWLKYEDFRDPGMYGGETKILGYTEQYDYYVPINFRTKKDKIRNRTHFSDYELSNRGIPVHKTYAEAKRWADKNLSDGPIFNRKNVPLSVLRKNSKGFVAWLSSLGLDITVRPKGWREKLRDSDWNNLDVRWTDSSGGYINIDLGSWDADEVTQDKLITFLNQRPNSEKNKFLSSWLMMNDKSRYIIDKFSQSMATGKKSKEISFSEILYYSDETEKEIKEVEVKTDFDPFKGTSLEQLPEIESTFKLDEDGESYSKGTYENTIDLSGGNINQDYPKVQAIFARRINTLKKHSDNYNKRSKKLKKKIDPIVKEQNSIKSEFEKKTKELRVKFNYLQKNSENLSIEEFDAKKEEIISLENQAREAYNKGMKKISKDYSKISGELGDINKYNVFLHIQQKQVAEIGQQLGQATGKYMIIQENQGSFLAHVWHGFLDGVFGGLGEVYATATDLAGEAVFSVGGYSKEEKNKLSKERREGVKQWMTTIHSLYGLGMEKPSEEYLASLGSDLVGTNLQTIFASTIRSLGTIMTGSAFSKTLGGNALTWAFSMDATKSIRDQLEKNPEFDDLPVLTKLAIANTYGLTQGVLEEIGVTAILKNKPALTGNVTNYILKKALERIPGNKSLLALEKALSYEAKSFMGRFGISVAGAGLKEFETGLLQNLTSDMMYGSFVNTILDSKMFEQPDSLPAALIELTEAGAAEGIGGLFFGLGNVAVQVVKTGNISNISPEQWAAFELISMDNNLLEDYKNHLRYEVALGNMTMSEGMEQLENIEDIKSIANGIDDKLNPETRKKIFGWSVQIKRLEDLREEKLSSTTSESLIEDINTQVDFEINSLNDQINTELYNARNETEQQDGEQTEQTEIKEEVDGTPPKEQSKVQPKQSLSSYLSERIKSITSIVTEQTGKLGLKKRGLKTKATFDVGFIKAFNDNVDNISNAIEGVEEGGDKIKAGVNALKATEYYKGLNSSGKRKATNNIKSILKGDGGLESYYTQAQEVEQQSEESKIISETTKKFADKIREGKIGKDGEIMSGIPGWNQALEVIATTVETSGEIAQNVSDFVNQGLSKIKEQGFFKKLNKNEQSDLLRESKSYLRDRFYDDKLNGLKGVRLDDDQINEIEHILNTGGIESNKLQELVNSYKEDGNDLAAQEVQNIIDRTSSSIDSEQSIEEMIGEDQNNESTKIIPKESEEQKKKKEKRELLAEAVSSQMSPDQTLNTYSEISNALKDNTNSVIVNDEFMTRDEFESWYKKNKGFDLSGSTIYSNKHAEDLKEESNSWYNNVPGLNVVMNFWRNKTKISGTNLFVPKNMGHYLRAAWKNSPKLKKYIIKNILQPMERAKFSMYKNSVRNMNEVRSLIEGLGEGIHKNGIKILNGEAFSVDVSQKGIRSGKGPKTLTVQQAVHWYATYLSAKGEQILKNSGASDQDIKNMKEYFEANPNIKKFAESISNYYNTTLRERYENHYKEVTGNKGGFGKNTYYPADKLNPNEGVVEFTDDGLNSNLSKNLEEKDLENATVNLFSNVMGNLNRYTESMEKSMHLSPIVSAYQSLFSGKNNETRNWFERKIGEGAFKNMQQEAKRFFNGSSYVQEDYINKAIGFYAQAKIGGRVKSTVQQFASFSHWWGAGLEYNLPFWDQVKQVPWLKAKSGLYSQEEMEMFNTIVQGDYIKLRAKTGGADIELQYILGEINDLTSEGIDFQKELKNKGSRAYKAYTRLNNLFVKLGDKGAITQGPASGVSFAMSLYQKYRADGMSHSEAMKETEFEFVKKADQTQQESVVGDIYRSEVQHNQLFRSIFMFRSSQMAQTKKAYEAIQNLQDYGNLTKGEKLQAVRDVIYHGAVSPFLFQLASTGSLYAYLMNSDDDEDKKRIVYDMGMDMIQSNAQGYAYFGGIFDSALNTGRGRGFFNNTLANQVLMSLTGTPWADADLDWDSEDKFVRKERFDEVIRYLRESDNDLKDYGKPYKDLSKSEKKEFNKWVKNTKSKYNNPETSSEVNQELKSIWENQPKNINWKPSSFVDLVLEGLGLGNWEKQGLQMYDAIVNSENIQEFMYKAIYGKNLQDNDDYRENQDKIKSPFKWNSEQKGNDALYYMLYNEHYYRKIYEDEEKKTTIKNIDRTKVKTVDPRTIRTVDPTTIRTVDPTTIRTVDPRKIDVEKTTIKSTDPVEEFDLEKKD
tara:strand:+ start:26055 stop:34169 length:8115 start_codon:yes stop_codon:yes gene_type:complete